MNRTRPHRLRRAFRLALATAASIAFAPSSAIAQSLPAGFIATPVASIGAPTAMAFTPDGRLLVTTQGGALRVVQDGTLLTTPALQFAAAAICTTSERGLLGIAVDPNFGFNNWIYVYYTANVSGTCVNRVSRFTLPGSNVVSPISEVVLLDRIPSPAGNHNGGDLHFGSDGHLYVSVGDGGCSIMGGGCAGSNDNARFVTQVLGKILRIHRDGSIPPSNPLVPALSSRRCADPAGPVGGSGPCQEIYAYGLRNPFRFAFRQGTNEFFINDVGQGAWEEIDRGILGADYGWNVREGPCINGSTTNCPPPPVSMTDPLYAYPHATGCRSITGGAFVPGRGWPASMRGRYLFADYVCGTIFSMGPSGATWSASTFGTGFGSPTALVMGPSATGRSLYYTTYAGGGAVRRIDFTAGPTFSRQDFDGNARSDLAWKRADGTVALWLMNGGLIASSAGYTVAGWDLVATGDFNGDGRSDLLFRRVSDGYLLAWLMNGGVPVAFGGYGTSGGLQVAAGDINGDGVDDLVLHGGGVLLVTLLDPLSGLTSSTANYSAGPDWQLAGKGDLNGDGTDDLVLRRTDGTAAIWLMNDLTIAGAASYGVGTEWSLRGVADLDGNGKADLIWRRNDGTVVFWFMNGGTIVSAAGYPQTTSWDVVGTADFNGDGRSDIVWRHTDGTVAIWLMNGAAIAGSVSYPLGPEWTAVGLQ